MSHDSVDLALAPQLERFEVRALLGRGAMGQVYRAFDRETGIEVALKTLGTTDPESLYRLKHEFRVLAGLTHANLVELYELWVQGRDSFFTMELVHGVDFRGYLRPDLTDSDRTTATAQTPPLERLLEAAHQLVTGVSALHASGRLHRDLKPANVLVTPAGRVVILDFGLATLLPRSGERGAPSAVVGTMAYLAPELAWGQEQTPAADWYSVGAMLYEVLSGCLPFEGTPAAVLIEKVRSKAPPLRSRVSGVPKALDSLVAALLEPTPADRPDGDAILAVLEGLGKNAGDVRSPRSSVPRTESPLLGREAELARLSSALDEIRRGGAAIMYVSGPSGIGKTTLIEHFLSTCPPEADTWTLRGRCHPQEALPFNAFDALMDDLAQRLASAPPELLAAIAPRRIADALRLFPVLGRADWHAAPQLVPMEGAAPFEIRRRGFAAVRELLARIADRRRLVLWIDDVQWADDDSVSLLRELRRLPDAPAILLILSHRDDSDALTLQAIYADSGTGDGLVDAIALSPLDREATQALATLLCRAHGVAEHDAEAIAAESAGSPFFLGELARHVRSGPAASTSAPRLSEVILARVNGLAPAARRLLEVISLAGQPLERGIALAAAGIGERGRPLIAALANACLLRPTTVHGHPGVHTYHDRIAETLSIGLSEAVRAERHGALADAWLSQDEPDPEAVYRHSLGAGRRAAAAEWAVEAANRAIDSLAFARASELYRQALELKAWDDAHRADLLSRRAGALVNAGQGAAAAPLFAAAAAQLAGLPGLDLRRHAAEQYLVSGHTDDGVAQLRSLLAALDLPYPASPGRAWMGLVGRLAQLWIRFRSLGVAQRDAATIPPSQLLRVDACNSAAKGLVQVDPIRGTYFSVLGLLLSLRCGEPTRVGRDLCLGGSALVVAGGSLARLGGRMLEEAQHIATQTQNPYLIGISAITTGVVSILEARWEEVLRLCDEGGAVLRDRCQGVTWERAIGQMAAIRALEELGEVAQAVSRCDAFQREAQDGGDLYAQVTARQYGAFWKLAAADSVGARSEARDALALWTHSGYHLQHFYALRLEVCCDIYEGAADTGWARLTTAWPALQRSSLLRHPVVRIDALILRGRAALAAATTGEARLRDVERDAHALARVSRPDAIAHAALLRAGVAATRGDAAAAQRLLGDAETRFARSGGRLNAAYARRRQGELIGGDRGAGIAREADELLAARAIVNPTRWLTVHAPGFAST